MPDALIRAKFLYQFIFAKKYRVVSESAGNSGGGRYYLVRSVIKNESHIIPLPVI